MDVDTSVQEAAEAVRDTLNAPEQEQELVESSEVGEVEAPQDPAEDMVCDSCQ